MRQFKNRYILFRINKQIEMPEMTKKLRKNMSYLCGELGLAASNLHIIVSEPSGSGTLFLVRTSRDMLRYVEAAVVILDGDVEIIKVSGTIKNQKKFIRDLNIFEDDIDEEIIVSDEDNTPGGGSAPPTA